MKAIVKGAVFAICIVVPAACAGNPQQLPVGVSFCRAVADIHGAGIVANVENKSDRPISRLELSAAFYQNFRYERYTASARLRQELDPGQKRDVSFAVNQTPPAAPQGQAIRCFVTHIGYLDGTSQDAPPNQ
jgi:hypothetical protein